MGNPKLNDAEQEWVRRAFAEGLEIRRKEIYLTGYPQVLGGVVALAGQGNAERVLFSAGTVESFEELMAQARALKKMSAKEIAIALLGAATSTPHGVKYLAAAAGVDYDPEITPVIVRRLAEAGKLKKVVTPEGKTRWKKA